MIVVFLTDFYAYVNGFYHHAHTGVLLFLGREVFGRREIYAPPEDNLLGKYIFLGDRKKL